MAFHRDVSFDLLGILDRVGGLCRRPVGVVPIAADLLIGVDTDIVLFGDRSGAQSGDLFRGRGFGCADYLGILEALVRRQLNLITRDAADRLPCHLDALDRLDALLMDGAFGLMTNLALSEPSYFEPLKVTVTLCVPMLLRVVAYETV